MASVVSHVRAIRQHHGVEHATITLLSQRLPRMTLAARSDLQGFVVYGEVETEALRAAVEEALVRLSSGETALAVHPNCGTNLAMAGVLSGLASFAASAGHRRSLWDRVPSAIIGATAGLMIALPAGGWLQRNLTTSADVRDVRLVAVVRAGSVPVTRHRVFLASSSA